MEKTNFTRRIAEGGLLVSLAFIFYFAGFTFSVIDLIKFVSVTPVVIGVVKYGTRQGIQITLASTFLTGLLLGFFNGLDFFLSIGLIGLVLGTCLRKNIKTFNTIFFTFIAALTGFSIGLIISVFLLNFNITREFEAAAKWFKSLVARMSEFGVINNFIITITDFLNLDKNWTNMSWIVDLFMNLLPSLLIFVAFYYVIYIWVFNVFLLKRLNIPLPDNAIIGEFSLFLIIPPWTLFFLLAGIIILLLNSYLNMRILEIICVNFIAIMIFVSYARGVFSMNIFIRNFIPPERKMRFLAGLFITFLEFTLLVPFVVLFGIFAIGAGIQNEELYFFLGNSYLKSGKFDSAIEYYKKVLELKPQRTVCHKLLAIAYQNKGNKDLAVKHFKWSLELDEKQKK